jgi:hypothetical protein
VATATHPTEAALAGLTPDEFVRALSDEQKDAVLTSLLREAIRLKGGEAMIPLEGTGGEPLGYFVPPGAAAHLTNILPTLSTEREKGLREAIANPDKTFEMDQFLDNFSREDQG